MTIIVKVTGILYADILRDLRRKHPFAAERVGFVAGRMAALPDCGRLIILTRYYSIPDDQYVRDSSVGARIGSDAITSAMQTVYHGRSAREGVFHVHMHGHRGETGMSPVDSREIPALLPGFRAVGSEAAHGIIVLSLDHGSAWVWLPDGEHPVLADSISIIGAPVGVFERRNGR